MIPLSESLAILENPAKTGKYGFAWFGGQPLVLLTEFSTGRSPGEKWEMRPSRLYGDSARFG